MRAQPRKEHLLDTAFELFNRHGYHATGIDLILEKSKVSKATMYKHFRSKDELVMAVLKRRHNQVLQQITTSLDNADASAQQPVLAIFDMLFNWFQSDDFYGCNFIKATGEFLNQHEIHQFAVAHKQQIRDLIFQYIQQNDDYLKAQQADTLSLLVNGAIINAQLSNSATPAIDAKNIARLVLQHE